MDKPAPENTTATVQMAAIVPRHFALAFADLARSRERSTAAELRLAMKAWLDAASAEQAA